MFPNPHEPSGQFHLLRSDDRGYAPFNKVIMKIQTPATSADGRAYFVTERKRTKPKPTLRKQMFRWRNFIY